MRWIDGRSAIVARLGSSGCVAVCTAGSSVLSWLGDIGRIECLEESPGTAADIFVSHPLVEGVRIDPRAQACYLNGQAVPAPGGVLCGGNERPAGSPAAS